MAVPFMDLGRQHAPLAGELLEAYERVLGASSFILGEEVERFEARFAELCGVSHCVGVASGTAALTIMLQAARIGPGDEVIVPAHTFIATALAVKHVGATPVCVDVEYGTGLIDPAAVSAAIGPAPRRSCPSTSMGRSARWTTCNRSRPGTGWRCSRTQLKLMARPIRGGRPVASVTPRRSASTRARTWAR
jgi:dTDP-4-amino-4,6-dideoxygalactose transaminase